MLGAAAGAPPEQRDEFASFLKGGSRPGRHRPGCESGATRWQRHRPVAPDDRLGWKAARTLARDTPQSPAVSNLSRYRHSLGVLEMREVQATAGALGLEVGTSEVRRAEDITPAFDALKGRADALYVVASPLMTTNRIRISILALGRN
jgi:hypothetical protein